MKNTTKNNIQPTILDWIHNITKKPINIKLSTQEIPIRLKETESTGELTSSAQNIFIPWVEKYRPSNFENIVLSDVNRLFFKNIIDKNYFPHLLLYGPPGIGKTTTIISLINTYQKKYSRINKYNVMHLNASDERGVDTIRIQINQFVNSMNLFEPGIKLIILDEVDFMTIPAQQALKTLIQSCSNNVKFCLICNYISKLDESLKNEFINIRFNKLPDNYIFTFIKNITTKEMVNIDDDIILSIQKLYDYDIRSMINFIQLNNSLKREEWKYKILNDEIFKHTHYLILNYNCNKETENKLMNNIIESIHNICIQYNIDKLTFIQKYFKYIIKNYTELVTEKFLIIVSTIIHDSKHISSNIIINYTVSQLSQLFLIS